MVGVLITVGLDLFLRSKVHGRVKVLGMGELPMELGYFSRRIMGDHQMEWSKTAAAAGTASCKQLTEAGRACV